MGTTKKTVKLASGGGAVLALGASLITTASPAGAATFNVTTTADSGAGSLRDAIAQANAAAGPDTITFQAGLGTIGLTTGDIDIAEDLVVTDPEGDVTIDAGGNSRIFYINSAGAVTLSGLTLQGGSDSDGGAVQAVDTDLTIADSTITGNESSGWGGGVFAERGAVTVTGSTFSGNYAYGYGGGLAVYDAPSATVTGTTFSENGAQYYGGGATFDNVTTVSITDSTFTDNVSYEGYGGGFWAYDGDTLTVTGSTFTGNEADGDGGGFGVDDFATVTIADTSFTDGYAGSDGGAFNIYGNQDGPTAITITNVTATGGESPDQSGGGAIQDLDEGSTVTVTGSTFSENSGVLGGGLTLNDVVGSTVTITDSTFSGNSADNVGGGLYLGGMSGSDTSITTSTFDGNDASYGGGIAASYAGALTITASTLSNNQAEQGGGLAARGTDVTIVNSTVSGNLAEDGGGGLGIGVYGETSDGLIQISHSTITGNTATYGGGIALFGDAGSSATLDHNLIDGNTAVGRPEVSGEPTFDYDGSAIFVGSYTEAPYNPQPEALDSVTLTNNLVNGSIAGVVVDGGGNVFNEPANLGPLADNGGPTQTHNLLAGSAALNAGSTAFAGDPTTDQRGLPRVAGGRIDIGAVEVQVQTPVVPPAPPAPPAEPVPAQPTFTG